jgi:hypothetical protein
LSDGAPRCSRAVENDFSLILWRRPEMTADFNLWNCFY